MTERPVPLLLILRRRPSNETCTIGELYDAGTLVCYICEDVVREIVGSPVSAWKVKGETAIPQGKYRITISHSERFGRDLPMLNMVPGFAGIRIHPGNGPQDTEGCLLPGMAILPEDKGVSESRVAFKKLYDLIDESLMAGDDVFIEIRNP